MRLQQLLFSAFALSAGLVRSVSASANDDDEFQLRQLTDENFKSETSNGVWLVEHFSPKCGHCRAFAPTWTQLAKDYQHLERLTGFHMTQVNCLAQGASDLCNANGIKFYPQIILYVDGKPSPHYSGDRSYEDLSKYIDEHSNNYSEQLLLQSSTEQGTSLVGRANEEGLVKDVNPAELEMLKQEGAVLTEYFAPWCGHCKKLRPIYEQLAATMKGKVNIAAVNCDDHHSFCSSSGVKGYPTIRMLHHGTSTEFTGARTLSALQKFAEMGQEAASIQSIKAGDFDDIVKANEAFFLFLQSYDTSSEEVDAVKKALEPLLGSVPAYTSRDPALYKRLHIANPPPTSTLLAFSSFSPRPVGTIALPVSPSDLSRFITQHKFPTLVQLDSSNFQSLMRSDSRAVVVLGAVHKGEAGKKELDEFAEVARAWKRGGRKFQQPVWFVWVDADKWSRWLKQFYSIKKANIPAIVVVDTPNEQYYDTTIEGNEITFDGASIFSVLEGFYQHFLRPKRIESTLEWSSRSAAQTLISLSAASIEHPIYALALLVAVVGAFVYFMQRCIGRDPREGSPISGTRLD
ncbi:protein disulfide-isomerase domain [Cryptococcus amylolentus CBS 6273]|uniref:Protein disulfide-isomerase domain n=1 Tax=Cryptococcus amylolentus CBS 6273 TaxID=1296118 RepID=A0A1E3JVK0_9TREE|nr:protein disulfide-isomerase domain [Cryptococcus amylolentus CBS 6273]